MLLKKFSRKGLLLLTVMTVVFVTACGNGNSDKNGASPSASSASPSASQPASSEAPSSEAVKLSGQIEIDGSSTVFPITEAVAEEFGKEQGNVKVAVGVSGTGGGFKRFCAGETAFSNASRPIKGEEAELCKTNGVEFTELKVAFDGLSVVVHKDNDFIDHLTVEELAKIFGTENPAKTWSEVRAGWPAEKILVFSPGADSGTFDYFNEEILAKKGLRTDDAVSLSEDDNTLVQGVAGSKYGIGYFGFAYYEENAGKLKVVPIDGGSGPVEPSNETIKDGSYSPLSRPLFIYVNNKQYERPEVKEFAKFFMDNVPELSAEVGYIPMPQETYDAEKAKL
ncbi:PstS family phosphate ABC transporter substrate-binding protein [Cohnella sp.]|uniref:PstS family phosphate ABC transporter substrate-binding protein n=1 Tax=Cohnella sp. TaxID=1883426 RepID=UPI00356B3366